jgi:hypothetical protein
VLEEAAPYWHWKSLKTRRSYGKATLENDESAIGLLIGVGDCVVVCDGEGGTRRIRPLNSTRPMRIVIKIDRQVPCVANGHEH